MPDRRLNNARIHGWLAPDLDRVAADMGSPKALVNSAAVWWFCRLAPEDRARILGEFVTAQAMRTSPAPPTDAKPNPGPPAGKRRGKKSARG